MANRTTIVEYWDYIFLELGDHRTASWPLIGSPVPGLTILAFYLWFVMSWGPRYMDNRKPFNLNALLVVYNAIQVCVSIWIVWEAIEVVYKHNLSFKCQSVDWDENEESMRVARGFYVYFLAKITELLDTVFFVLRKKYNQITFLHLYHHTVMPMISWGAVKYYPGGHGFFVGFINSFVHIIMYTYYMLSAMGPHYQKYLWWKKYITTIQLIQFLLTFLHSMQLLFYDCDYPKWSVCIVMPNAIFFYLLFNDFYQKAYSSKKTA